MTKPKQNTSLRQVFKQLPEPEWLKAIGAEAKRKGLNKLTMRQIDAEIATARNRAQK